MSVTISGSGQIVKQVIQTIKTDTFSTTSTSFVDVTGLSATITPTNASNKILIFAQIANTGGNGNAAHFKLSGGNTATYVGNAAGSRVQGVFGGYWITNETDVLLSGTIIYMDSPATTSPVTYTVQTRKGAAGSNPSQVNVAIADGDNTDHIRGASSIIVMEIAYA